MIPKKRFSSFLLANVALVVLTASQTASAQKVWTWRNPSTPGDNISSIVWANNQFVAVTSDYGFVLTSPDGINWTHRFTANDDFSGVNRFHSVIWTGNRYVVAGGTGSNKHYSILTSPDGINWTGTRKGTDSAMVSIAELNSVIWTGSRIVAVGINGPGAAYIEPRTFVSSDGNSWTSVNNPFGRWKSVISTDSLIVSLGDSGVVNVSKDGITWERRTAVKSNNYRCAIWTENGILAATQFGIVKSTDYGVTWKSEVSWPKINAMVKGADKIVAVGDSGTCTVYDGTSWSTTKAISGNDLYCVTWTGKQFVAGGRAGTLMTSSDGKTWTQLGSNPSIFINSTAWTGTQYVGVGGNIYKYGSAGIVTSPDGIVWTEQACPIKRVLFSVAWSGEKLVAVGDSGYILTSSNGQNWTINQPHLTATTFNGVVWGNGEFMAVGDNGMVYTSSDGVNWTKQDAGTMNDLKSVIWTGNMYMAVGWPGCIIVSTDGKTWKGRVSGTDASFSTVASGKNSYMIGGYSGFDPVVWISSDALTWTMHKFSYPFKFELVYSIIWDGRQYLITGERDFSQNTSAVLSTTDAVNWTVNSLDTRAPMRTLLFNGEQYLVAGDSGIVFTSPIEATEIKQCGKAQVTNSRPLAYTKGNQLHISLETHGSDKMIVRIFDLNGKLAGRWDASGPELIIPGRSLRSGRYLLQVTSQQNVTKSSAILMFAE